MADTVNDLTTAIGRKQGAVEPDECCSVAIARLSNRSLISNVGTASCLSAAERRPGVSDDLHRQR